MAKKKHAKKHATNVNHNKNVVHIHIGDKKSKSSKRKKAASAPVPHSHFSFNMPQTTAPQFHLNRPQQYDLMPYGQRDAILGIVPEQAPVQAPVQVPVQVPVPVPRPVAVPAPVQVVPVQVHAPRAPRAPRVPRPVVPMVVPVPVPVVPRVVPVVPRVVPVPPMVVPVVPRVVPVVPMVVPVPPMVVPVVPRVVPVPVVPRVVPVPPMVVPVPVPIPKVPIPVPRVPIPIPPIHIRKWIPAPVEISPPMYETPKDVFKPFSKYQYEMPPTTFTGQNPIYDKSRLKPVTPRQLFFDKIPDGAPENEDTESYNHASPLRWFQTHEPEVANLENFDDQVPTNLSPREIARLDKNEKYRTYYNTGGGREVRQKRNAEKKVAKNNIVPVNDEDMNLKSN